MCVCVCAQPKLYMHYRFFIYIQGPILVVTEVTFSFSTNYLCTLYYARRL